MKSDYQFKGQLAENYVLQQMIGQFDVPLRYYSTSHSELDFLAQYNGGIIPIEVKAGGDKSAPSFKRYIAEKQPEYALRFSKREYRTDGMITNIPLYLANRTNEILCYQIIRKAGLKACFSLYILCKKQRSCYTSAHD